MAGFTAVAQVTVRARGAILKGCGHTAGRGMTRMGRTVIPVVAIERDTSITHAQLANLVSVANGTIRAGGAIGLIGVLAAKAAVTVIDRATVSIVTKQRRS